MSIKIKMVIGLTLIFIFLGLGYIMVNTTILYQEQIGTTIYNYKEKKNRENKILITFKQTEHAVCFFI